MLGSQIWQVVQENPLHFLKIIIICYMPMQLVAPRAVTIAVAIDAIICTMNLMVSLLVIV